MHVRWNLAKLQPEQFQARAWPGNVRELRNAVQAYSALGVLPPAGANAEVAS